MTDAQLHAEILSWSRSRGVFAGISLQGATLRPDDDSNKELYKTKVTNQEILTGKVAPPKESAGFMKVLQDYSVATTPKKGE